MINRDAWLRAVEAAQHAPLPESTALSIEEFSELIGLCRTAAKRRMVALVAAGRATQASKRIRKTDGRTQLVVAYELVEDAMKKDLDIERQSGLDGAHTTDSDDPGADSADDYVRATRSATIKASRQINIRKERNGRKRKSAR